MRIRRGTSLRPVVSTAGERMLKVRASEEAANRIQWLADTYAGGNLSLWMRYAALEAPRKYLVPPSDKQKTGKKKLHEKKGS